MTLKSINPYTGSLVREFEEISSKEIDNALSMSAEAFEGWKRSSFEHRSALMEKVAAELRANSGKYAEAMTIEMGKPIKESKSEIDKCAWVCEYYAKNAAHFLATEIVETDADRSYVTYEPLGTILGIMPWNFPFWQVFRFAVPTLMAGNAVLLKHASNVQICANEIENIFRNAGFPEGLYRNLVLGPARVKEVISHNAVMGVSLTGSESAGRKVAEEAGHVLKKCVMELGGSNAFVVLEDANVRKAAETGVKARFQNAGQSCIAAKRFIIERKISCSFINEFVAGVKKLKPGDPLEVSTDIGPLSGVGQAEKVEEQVNRSVEMGARIIEGGARHDAFYQPTVVTNVRPGMPLFDEEVFGPVAAVTEVSDISEAISVACHTNFGLGVSLFTGDLEMASRLAGEFHDGAVFINGLVKSDPRLPFGGTRHSGFGRELSVHGIREFVNVKSVWMKKV